ncbi:MAG: porin, partial [Stenotrophomonas maltophilia]|nr:porin [Stenotrophomonas maltophilia]
MRLAVLSLACLGALAITPAYAHQGDAEDAQALRREIAAMRQALEGMQQRLDRLEQRDAAPAQATAAPAMAPMASAAPSDVIHRTQVPGVAQPVLPQRDSVADPSTAASRPDSAAGPTDPDLKEFFAIPGTDTVIRIG